MDTLKVTLKTVKLTLAIFRQLPTISAFEFQDESWVVLGFVRLKQDTYFICQKEANYATIPTDMWSYYPVSRGGWGVSGFGFKSKEQLSFHTKVEAEAYVDKQRDSTTPLAMQIFL